MSNASVCRPVAMWRGAALLLLAAAASRAEQLFAGLHEGDIAVRGSSHTSNVSAAFLSSRIWDYGVVPYVIDASIREEEHRELIKEVINDIHGMATCIIFEDMEEMETQSNSYLK